MKFTIDELNTLIQLLDIATKAGGLNVANQALPLVAKMQQMAQEIQPQPATASATASEE
jgi:hypothetical protein